MVAQRERRVTYFNGEIVYPLFFAQFFGKRTNTFQMAKIITAETNIFVVRTD